MSDQWGAAQPPYDPQQQSQQQQNQGQAPFGGGAPQHQQYGQAPQFGAPVPGQSQPQPQYGAPMPDQSQAQYGVPMPDQSQVQYGAPMPDQSQPQYGAPAPMPDQSGGQQYPYGQSQSTLGTPGQFDAQPQYGVPGQQAGYGQPGYGADPYAGAYAGAPYGGAAPKKTNGFALAGAIICFAQLFGLIFSIIGLVKAKSLGGAGKTAATVGIVLSILFAGGYGFAAVKLASSTALDPACISSEAAATSMQSKLTADETALTTAENANDTAGIKTALDTMVSDLQTVKGELDTDLTKATHADVKTKLQALDTDLGKLLSDVPAVESGNSSAATDLATVANRLTPDGDAVDSLCGNATNG